MDNEPGKTALTKGCGKDRKVNRLLAALWSFITAEEADPHWRRVCSAANIADGVSRGDLQIPHQERWVEIQANWEELYTELARCTASLQNALHLQRKLCRAAKLGRETMARSSRATMGGRTGCAHTDAIRARPTGCRASKKEVSASAGPAVSERS